MARDCVKGVVEFFKGCEDSVKDALPKLCVQNLSNSALDGTQRLIKTSYCPFMWVFKARLRLDKSRNCFLEFRISLPIGAKLCQVGHLWVAAT